MNNWAALCEKVPNALSRSHTKRWTGARGRVRPSFGMTPTFPKKKSQKKFSKKKNLKSPPFFWYDNDAGR